ncbi:hypothetical protein DCO44_16415 [Acinetobacter sp. AM]|uniref:virulence factor TspB C-terminal domain-related protein n=1 Tax=Acinetobacter sp. AM TaxID=2170730 RepID=UPI000DE5E8FE|nr:virulence factor TspB C-terminal domain-related protein [Acinetobacter sp. AM]PWB12988.1 hypothetical protein DCO44_16415 [Acinetobacter sp. AM]
MGRHQKYLRIFLSFVLAISPIILINQANAGTVGGWTMSNPIAEGASAIYTGTKKVLINGAEVVKTGTAKITPAASHVARVLARGGAAAALSVAVEQLLGAVDWVLDPANNRVIYYVDPNNTACVYLSVVSQSRPDLAGCGLAKAWQNYLPVYLESNTSYNNYTLTNCVQNNTSDAQNGAYYSGTCYYTRQNISTGMVQSTYENIHSIPNPNHNTDKEKKYLPLDTVAGKVIENAKTGDPVAQVATMAAAADIVKDAETDQAKAAPIVQQLENSAVTETDETATGTQTKDPANPDVTDLSIEFPAFCGWAPTVCEAAQTVISFPTTLTNWWDTATTSISEAWTFAKDWATSEPETDTNLDIDTSEESEPNTDISFSTSCPAKIPLQFNWNGQSLDFSFDFTIWCQAISTYVYPIVVTLGSLHALYIVTGVRQDG